MRDVAANGEAGGRTFRGYADGSTVANFRDQLHAWLDSAVDLDAERICDIVLATSEALTNAADHAYRADHNSGVVTLELHYDADNATVTVRVTDEGRWVEPTPTTVTAIRGRGLHLMRALADACSVDGRADGTSVTLTFHDCPGLEDLASRFG